MDQTDPNIAIIAGVVTIVLTVAGFGIPIHRQSRQANRAVNNTEAGEPRLIEKVNHIANTVDRYGDRYETIATAVQTHAQYWEDFHRRWGNLPADIEDATELTVMLRRLDDRITALDRKLSEHDEWERHQKHDTGPHTPV